VASLLCGGWGNQHAMELLLWILAIILVVSGVFALFRSQILWGIVLIIVGFLVGPGGVSVFTGGGGWAGPRCRGPPPPPRRIIRTEASRPRRCGLPVGTAD
jgi:hypothetical protein